MNIRVPSSIELQVRYSLVTVMTGAGLKKMSKIHTYGIKYYFLLHNYLTQICICILYLCTYI